MSQLVLGTAQFGLDYGINNSLGKIDLAGAADIIRICKDSGIKQLDTAQAYGDSEFVLKECLKIVPQNFLIHTKFSFQAGIKDPDFYLKKSLRNLGVSSLGFFFFHKYSDFIEYGGLNVPKSDFLEEKTLGLGVSIYDDDEFEFAIGRNFVKAIQIPLNVFDFSSRKMELVGKAKEKGISVFSRSVFLQGLFFMDTETLPPKLKSFAPALNELNRISENSNISKIALSLGFVKNLNLIDGVLIGVDSKKQLIQNLKAWSQDIPSEVIKDLRRIQVADKSILRPNTWSG